jgi:signal transduction histidine kinase
MNRFWVRLSITFGAVILLSLVVIGGFTLILLRANIERGQAADEVSAATQAASTLAAFYQTNGTWDDVASLLESVMLRPDAAPRPPSDLVVLTDPDGNAIQGAFNPDITYRDPVPITVAGSTQGLLYMAAPARGTFFPLWGILNDVGLERLVLLLGIVVGAVSILFGILISRWLTRPLDVLAEAAHDVGEGNLERRVPPSGSQETVLVAESFNRMVAQLQRAEKLRRDLVADVAHELRTPISALQANLYAILDDAYPMTKTEIAGLYEQTRVLSRLVDDLHELTLAEAHRLPMNFALAHLDVVIEDIVSPFYVVAESKDITFTLNVATGLPTVLVDRQRLSQVMHNLLSNALRHTPEAGTISVTVAMEGAAVSIAVHDSGSGISPEHLPHVFERFYRDDFARSREAGGAGLGLAIARAIAEAHHGTLTVASEGVGKGATFTLRLPVTHNAVCI